MDLNSPRSSVHNQRYQFDSYHKHVSSPSSIASSRLIESPVKMAPTGSDENSNVASHDPHRSQNVSLPPLKSIFDTMNHRAQFMRHAGELNLPTPPSSGEWTKITDFTKTYDDNHGNDPALFSREHSQFEGRQTPSQHPGTPNTSSSATWIQERRLPSLRPDVRDDSYRNQEWHRSQDTISDHMKQALPQFQAASQRSTPVSPPRSEDYNIVALNWRNFPGAFEKQIKSVIDNAGRNGGLIRSGGIYYKVTKHDVSAASHSQPHQEHLVDDRRYTPVYPDHTHYRARSLAPAISPASQSAELQLQQPMSSSFHSSRKRQRKESTGTMSDDVEDESPMPRQSAKRRRTANAESALRRRQIGNSGSINKDGRHARNPSSKDKMSTNWTEYDDLAPAWETAKLDNPLKDVREQAVKNRVDLTQDELRHELNPEELDIARKVNISCETYLLVKRQMFTKFVEHLRLKKRISGYNGNWNKTAAQKASNVDVGKVSQVWVFFNNIGWFDEKLYDVGSSSSDTQSPA